MAPNEKILLQEVSRAINAIPQYEQKSRGNIFRVLEVEDKEVIMCRYLADLLDPNGEHGQGILFLKSFCEQVIKISNQSDDLLSKSIITKEYRIGTGEEGVDRRIDIVISNSKHFIPIEVKIFAKEQKNQCFDYYEYAVGQDKNTKIVYLTRFRTMPSEYSRKTLSENEIICIGWEEDILPWLEKSKKALPIDETIILNQYIDAVHDIAYGRDIQIMDKTKAILIQSADNMRAGLAVEKSMKIAKLDVIKSVFEEFKNQMESYCKKYDLEYEHKADYYTYDSEGQERFYDCYSTYPGLNYVVRKAKFKDSNIQMWFRIEVEQNLFAGFSVYDFSAETQENKIGYEVQEITEFMFQEAAKYLDDNIFMKGQGWWLTWVYPNGMTKESNRYDDVPNFRSMNECAVKLSDKKYRKKYVELALNTFETMLLSKLK